MAIEATTREEIEFVKNLIKFKDLVGELASNDATITNLITTVTQASWQKKVFDPSVWTTVEGNPNSNKFNVCQIAADEVLESVLLHYQEKLDNATDSSTYVMLSLGDYYSSDNFGLTDPIPVGTGSSTPLNSIFGLSSIMLIYQPYMADTLVANTLDITLDNSTEGSGLANITSGKFTVYYKIGKLPTT